MSSALENTLLISDAEVVYRIFLSSFTKFNSVMLFIHRGTFSSQRNQVLSYENMFLRLSGRLDFLKLLVNIGENIRSRVLKRHYQKINNTKKIYLSNNL